MGKPLVSIIIINWNGGVVFRNCLTSLSKINYPSWELIVVDNGSSDGTQEFAKIKNKVNLGFAKANNQGYNAAKGKYILLLNNDTKVTPDFLTILVDRMESDPTLGVVQPKIKIMDKPKLLDNSGAFLTRTGFLEHWGYMAKDGKEFEMEREVFTVKGACMLIRRDVIEKVGLFDDDFVSYMEETDFCWRVWLAGWRVLFTPAVHIYHKVGFTSRAQDQIFVNYHSFKNRILSLLKNLDRLNLFVIGGFHIFLIISLSFYYLLKLQFKKTVMIWNAILWNVVNINKTLEKRAEIQQMRAIGDAEIFRKVLHTTNWRKMLSHFTKVEANF